jgi:hypothetical protein
VSIHKWATSPYPLAASIVDLLDKLDIHIHAWTKFYSRESGDLFCDVSRACRCGKIQYKLLSVHGAVDKWE